MPSSDPLSRLLDVLQPSLVMYLSDSGIWTYPGDEEIKLALADLVSDQRSMVERAGVLLEERGGAVATPAYPITFTGCHDVDMGSLLPRVIESLRRQGTEIDTIAAAGPDDAAVRDLVREARTTSQRHLDVLQQVAAAARLRRQQKAGPEAQAPAAI